MLAGDADQFSAAVFPFGDPRKAITTGTSEPTNQAIGTRSGRVRRRLACQTTGKLASARWRSKSTSMALERWHLLE